MTKDTSSTIDTLFDFQVTTEQSTIRSGFAHNISHQARTFNLYIIISSIRSVGFGISYALNPTMTTRRYEALSRNFQLSSLGQGSQRLRTVPPYPQLGSFTVASCDGFSSLEAFSPDFDTDGIKKTEEFFAILYVALVPWFALHSSGSSQGS